MRNDVTNFADTDVHVSRDFMRMHGCTKTNDSPLDGFRGRLTLSHCGGEMVSSTLSAYGNSC